MARRWPENQLVAKDGDKVIGFVGYGEHRDDAFGGAAFFENGTVKKELPMGREGLLFVEV